MSDPKKRKIYDKYGEEGLKEGGPGVAMASAKVDTVRKARKMAKMEQTCLPVREIFLPVSAIKSTSLFTIAYNLRPDLTHPRKNLSCQGRKIPSFCAFRDALGGWTTTVEAGKTSSEQQQQQQCAHRPFPCQVCCCLYMQTAHV